MGFDIEIQDIDTNNIQVRSIMCRTYLSYNWSVYKNYWYFRRDMDGRRCGDAAILLQQAIDTLKGEEIHMLSPDLSNPNWYYGVQNDTPYPDSERKGIFLYILSEFLHLATLYPSCFFISDQCSEICIDGVQYSL